MTTSYDCFLVLEIEWLLYVPHQLEFQGLNGYATCVHWSSKDRMAILHMFVGVPRIKWLLYMHPLEFLGFNGYYICPID
jgi:hypothetical protein